MTKQKFWKWFGKCCSFHDEKIYKLEENKIFICKGKIKLHYCQRKNIKITVYEMQKWKSLQIRVLFTNMD